MLCLFNEFVEKYREKLNVRNFDKTIVKIHSVCLFKLIFCINIILINNYFID